MQVNETLSTAGKDEGFKPRSDSTQYSYDANGNIIYDPNKEMRVLYNHLNLPQRITIDGCKFIEFLYDAAGNKLQKTIKEGAMTLRTHDYLAGIEYQNGHLDAIYHAEGRVYYQDSTSRYEFCLKDHLSNTRLTFTDKNQDGVITLSATPDSNEVLSEQHYYPFGLAYNGPWIDNKAKQTRYQYNGKELNEDFELGWYDYGARWYDAAIGRWNAVDPLAELDHNVPISPYHYVANNPIINVDPDGMDWYQNNETGEYICFEGSDNRRGYTNVGAYYIHEGEDNYVVHHQNTVIATVSKSKGDYEEAYTR